MKHKYFSFGFIFIAAITLSACKMSVNPNNTSVPNNDTASENDSNNTTDRDYVVPDDGTEEPLELWEIDEFQDFMEQQGSEIQKLADNSVKSFYEKDSDGDYVCRPWTQEDVDTLYAQWEEQLSLMKQGYHFTKPITLTDGGSLIGEFDPETWNSKPETTPSSTIIKPDGSSVDLGH